MSLGSSYRVQVSRLMLSPFGAIAAGRGQAEISPKTCDAFRFLLVRNSGRTSNSARFLPSGANSSLLSPRHRCYAPLSARLLRLVGESGTNSYHAQQDGLW